MSSEKEQSGSGTQRLYRVEVRNNSNQPLVLPLASGKHFAVGREWTPLPVEHHDQVQGMGAVPSGFNERVAKAHYVGAVGYNAAQAHRYIFLASIDAGAFGGFCVETRLVAVELKYSYETRNVGVSAPVTYLDHINEKFAPLNGGSE